MNETCNRPCKERNNPTNPFSPPSPREETSNKLADLGTLTTDTTSQLNILRHNSHTLGMDSTKVSILKQSHQISLTRLLQRQNSRRLKPQISLEILRNLPHKTLKGCLADQQVGGLLVLADLTEGNGTGTVTVGFLDASGGGCGFACGLGGELFAGGFASGGFTGGLLGTVGGGDDSLDSDEREREEGVVLEGVGGDKKILTCNAVVGG